MRKKIIATGGIVTSLFIAGASTALAQANLEVLNRQTENSPTTINLKYLPNTGPKLTVIAAELGLKVDDIQEELRSGKTPKQIFKEYGISNAKIKKVFSVAKFKANNRNKIIQNISS